VAAPELAVTVESCSVNLQGLQDDVAYRRHDSCGDPPPPREPIGIRQELCVNASRMWGEYSFSRAVDAKENAAASF